MTKYQGRYIQICSLCMSCIIQCTSDVRQTKLYRYYFCYVFHHITGTAWMHKLKEKWNRTDSTFYNVKKVSIYLQKRIAVLLMRNCLHDCIYWECLVDCIAMFEICNYCETSEQTKHHCFLFLRKHFLQLDMRYF